GGAFTPGPPALSPSPASSGAFAFAFSGSVPAANAGAAASSAVRSKSEFGFMEPPLPHGGGDTWLSNRRAAREASPFTVPRRLDCTCASAGRVRAGTGRFSHILRSVRSLRQDHCCATSG